MNILHFEEQHIEGSKYDFFANYYDERQFVKELPKVCDIHDLNDITENGLWGCCI